MSPALTRAAAGMPAAALITGEAGVGKTRLVREFAEWARGEGVPVWVGSCLPIGNGLVPYMPIGTIVRALTHDLGADRIRALAGPSARWLVLLAPELADDPVVVAAYLALADAERARARVSNANGGTAQVRAGAAGASRAAWAHAVALWEGFECPYQHAYSRWRLVEASLAARGSRRGAQRLLAEASAVATELGAAPLCREVAGLSSRARLGPGPAGPRSDNGGRAAGLTPRELQVLTLITEGASNRQIARTLFIAENTVNIHVSRLLAKLDVANRSAAAAAARRRGLVTG